MFKKPKQQPTRAATDCRVSRRLLGDADDFVAVKVPLAAEFVAAAIAADTLFDRYRDCNVIYVNVVIDPQKLLAHVIAFLPPWPQAGEDAYVLFRDVAGEPVDVRAEG